jgi:glyoxylase-like metal-dependent hydrolase (beta-lactamase superfamily II)
MPRAPDDLTAAELQTEPFELAPGVYWVGKRDPRNVFHANPYLRSWEGTVGGERRAFHLLIDPGSTADLAFVRMKVEGLLGSLDRISAIYLNHQDPDVASSSPTFLTKHAPNASVICSKDTWRLVRHLCPGRRTFVNTQRHPEGLTLPTGHPVCFVPTPFCHFAGAVCLYDLESRILFTGDLFGGLTEIGAEGFFATESDWAGMRAFHQLYMPSNQALRRAIAAIRALDPAPAMLAPQHGRVIGGPLVEEMLRRLEELPVGLDLLEPAAVRTQRDPAHQQAWANVLGRLLELASGLGVDTGSLDGVDASTRPPTFRGDGQGVVEEVLSTLGERATGRARYLLIYEAVAAAEALSLPTPRVQIDEAPAA